MNIRSLVYIILFSFCPVVLSVDETISSAIKSSDIEALSRLLMPGSYVRLQDRKVYSSLAQQKTKEAYMNLQSLSFADINHSIGVLAKAATTAFFAKAFYDSLSVNFGGTDKGYAEEDGTHLDNTILNGIKSEVYLRAKNQEYKNSVSNLGNLIYEQWEKFFLAAVAVYFGYGCKKEVDAILSKDDRYQRYIRALAIESLVARVPVFEQ